MKRLLMVLFGMLVTQGSVWANAECRKDVQNTMVTAPGPDETIQVGEYHLTWSDSEQKFGSRTNTLLVTLREWTTAEDAQKGRIERKWYVKNTGVAKLRGVAVAGAKSGTPYFFTIAHRKDHTKLIQSPCFTFASGTAGGAPPEDDVAALRKEIQALRERIARMEGEGAVPLCRAARFIENIG